MCEITQNDIFAYELGRVTDPDLKAEIEHAREYDPLVRYWFSLVRNEDREPLPEPFREAGRQLAERVFAVNEAARPADRWPVPLTEYSLVLGSGSRQTLPPARWEIGFGEGTPARTLVRELAGRSYGDPKQRLDLFLHARPVGPDGYEPILEVWPAPTEAALELVIEFPTGAGWTVSVAGPATTGTAAFSEPGDLLPSAAFAFDTFEWRVDEIPPRLVLGARN